MTTDRSAGIPRKSGEIVDITRTSYPEIPICQRGKYQIKIPNEVRMDQKTKPL